MLMDDTCKAKQKSLGKEWRIFNTTIQFSLQNNTVHSKRRLTGGQKRTTVSNMNRMPEILIQVLKPSWAAGRFSTSGTWDCSRWEAREWIKVKPEEGCIFEKGRYNCIIQGQNIIMPQRRKVLFELVLKEHRELKMCLMACISTATLNQSLDL